VAESMNFVADSAGIVGKGKVDMVKCFIRSVNKHSRLGLTFHVIFSNCQKYQ